MKIETFVAETEEDVQWIYERLRENEIIACDVETNHFGWKHTKLLSIGFSWKEETGVSIPLLHKDAKLNIDINELRLILKDKKLIFHNAQFDLKQLWKYGIVANAYFDTMLAHYIALDERQGTHALKQLAKRYLNYEYFDVHDLLTSRKKSFETIPLDTLLKYNANDAGVTFMLYKLFKDKVPPMFYDLMIPASTTLSKIEFRGMKVNRDYLIDVKKGLTKELNKVESEIKNKYKFDPRSPKKTLMYFQSLGFELETVRGYQLLTLARKNDAAKLLWEHRKIRKLLSGYTDTILEKLDENKYLHTSYLLHGTVIGRLSSRNPNLTNIPRDSRIKKMFIPSKDYLFLEADYKQAEMRIAAILSKDENLIKAFIEHEDIHQATAKKIFGKDEINKNERVIAKSINFGFLFGRGAGSISAETNISYREAKQMLDKFYSSYPKIRKFINECKRQATTKKYLKTLTGRTLRYREGDDKRKLYAAAHFPIASLQSDICLSSLVAIDNLLNNTGFRARPVLIIYDSILLEVPEYELAIVSRMVKKVMEEMPNKYIKNNPLEFPIDLSVGENWADLKKYVFDIDYTDEDQLKLFKRKLI